MDYTCQLSDLNSSVVIVLVFYFQEINDNMNAYSESIHLC